MYDCIQYRSSYSLCLRMIMCVLSFSSNASKNIIIITLNIIDDACYYYYYYYIFHFSDSYIYNMYEFSPVFQV